MPTFGWVQEDAWDRILTATESVPEPSGERAPTFACPFCSRILQTPAEFQAHLSASHHVARPMMLIAGKEPTSSFVLRERVLPSDIVLANVTSASLSIDGISFKKITATELGRALARTNLATVRVRLENAAQKGTTPVTGGYDLSIRVASSAALQAVERAFEEHLNVEGLSVGTVDRFLADPRCAGAASDYATGMAEYALGLLIKERPHGQGITSPLERFREHFGSANLKLSPHNRPLPALLCALMRFALNNFSGAGVPTGHAGLDAATAILRGPSFHGPPIPTSPGGATRRVCPIDHGTSRILLLADRLAGTGRWSSVLQDECRQVAGAGTLDLMDQQKALALWALAAWRLGATRDAIEPLERIAATYPFAEWASSYLEAVSA
ncbi:hypothetical protein [Microvirga aerophila]|uniref:C2H2-type domain-containing protein n=1 Tax=Microvirga aerophila TaxID=670291 RepID=A0A512BKX6_9HYPH|nr:hypothetical protein [Microvirga aerophila]GEO12626.1 hypothetical protein MAE02_03220 [Microvirga aerophila]